MEAQAVLSGDNIRNSVSTISNRSESTTSSDKPQSNLIREPSRIRFTLIHRGLGGREEIGRREDGVEERRFLLQIALDDVEGEEMSVDTLTAHGISVQLLMLVTSLAEQGETIFRGLGGVEHGSDEFRRLDGARADSFSAAFAEQTCHRSFVGQRELVLILEVRVLEGHLEEGVWRDLQPLRESFSVVRPHKKRHLNVVDESIRDGQRLADLFKGRLRNVPLQTLRLQNLLRLSFATAILIVADEDNVLQ